MHRLFFQAVLLAEPFHAAGAVHDFLFAGVKRVAGGTNLNIKIVAQGRAGGEGIAAGASDLDFLIFRVDTGFHCYTLNGCLKLAAFRLHMVSKIGLARKRYGKGPKARIKE
jgi:hypothetical protein